MKITLGLGDACWVNPVSWTQIITLSLVSLKGKAKEYKSVIMPKTKINSLFALSKFYRQPLNAGQVLVSGTEA